MKGANVENKVTQLTPSQLTLALRVMFKANLPVMLWGPPGVGKSQIVHQTGATMNGKVIDLRMAQFDPVDLRGIPFKGEDGRTMWAPPGVFPIAERDGEEGVLFLDELNSAPPAVQAAGYQLVLDRALGEYHMPPGWRVVAAGNRETDRGVAYRMPTPLANRFAHFEVVVDLQDWVVWANGAGIRPEIVAFVRWRPEYLHRVRPNKLGEGVSYPTFLGIQSSSADGESSCGD